ncbi:MAG: alpha-glucosidase [Alphaproteobacteria bacterium]|nr:alpha-glucosidase [Alphaproteobacteria bacterium]
MARSAKRHPAEVIYQVYPSSFNDANGDGQGDIAGITQKLDYIKSLGVDSIWISPVYLSPPGPEGDGGYAVSDYRQIDPRYGTMQDFKDLLKEAHARGLRVYTDWVVAHTANDHDWFEKSRKGDPKYKDYYVWADGKQWNGRTVPPNNWKSVFGGAAWTYDQERGQYYLHHFLKSQPALNLNKKEVQDAVLDEMKFWLDMGVDGFRVDALPFATCDEKLRDNPWLYGIWPNVKEQWDQQRFDHSMIQPQTVDFIARIRALMDGYPEKKTTIGEATAGAEGGLNPLPVAAQYVDLQKGLDMSYTWAVNDISPKARDRLADIVRALGKYFPDGGHCLSVGNHDIPRTFSRTAANVPPAEALAAHKQMMEIFFTLPGSVILYQGEELALEQARIPLDIPLDKLKDPTAQTQGLDACRDGSRTPMPWDGGKPNAGFSSSNDPYLPVPAAHVPKAVAAQEKDADSMLRFMRKLIARRKARPALEAGTATVLNAGAPLFAYLRENGGETLLCAFNMSGQSFSFKPEDILDDATIGRLSLQKGQTVTLAAYGSFFKDAPPQGVKAAPAPQSPPPVIRKAV